jgi:hypothetical protein
MHRLYDKEKAILQGFRDLGGIVGFCKKKYSYRFLLW